MSRQFRRATGVRKGDRSEEMWSLCGIVDCVGGSILRASKKSFAQSQHFQGQLLPRFKLNPATREITPGPLFYSNLKAQEACVEL
jgi:hypothetical protein